MFCHVCNRSLCVISVRVSVQIYFCADSHSELMLEPITRSLHLPYKPYETTFARIFLFLETVGLLDWYALYAIRYNIINTTQHNTTQHKAIQYSALLATPFGQGFIKCTSTRIRIFLNPQLFFWIQLPSTRIQRTRQRIRIYKLRVDGGIFEFAKKKLRIKRYPDTRGQALKRIYFSSFDFPIS